MVAAAMAAAAIAPARAVAARARLLVEHQSRHGAALDLGAEPRRHAGPTEEGAEIGVASTYCCIANGFRNEGSRAEEKRCVVG